MTSRLPPRRFRLTPRSVLAAVLLGAYGYGVHATRDVPLTVTIVDAANGQPTPVRVGLQDAAGNRPGVAGALAVSDSAIPIPKQAIAVMWGQQDRAQGYALQPDGSFYVDGAFEAAVPPGAYTLRVSKGFEYVGQTVPLEIGPSSGLTREVRLERWIDMPARGWYSSDDHIHLRRSPADDPAIVRWIAAEDVHVGNLLQMGDFWAVYFSQYAFGPRGRYEELGRWLSPGQEDPRTPEVGHTISLGASQFARVGSDYYSYDRLFDRVHELGGITGFAHQGMSFHGYRGMTLNTLRGKTDFLELAQFCVPEGPLALDHYYLFLDLGIRLTALAGSDFPWCGRVALAVVLAMFYGESRRSAKSLSEVCFGGLFLAVPGYLILQQPDLGTAVTLLPVYAGVVYLAGLRLRWLAAAAVVLALLSPVIWTYGLHDYQRERVVTFFDPQSDPRGAGYQQIQAKVTVGSGGLLGKGFRGSTQGSGGFLPVAHNDFVFSVLAEEHGFVGVLVALGLYMFVISRSLDAAKLAKDRVGAYLVAAIVSGFGFQVLYNITMSAGFAPVKGLTLPLMSYGGSSLVATFAGFGLILNVRMRRFTN